MVSDDQAEKEQPRGGRGLVLLETAFVLVIVAGLALWSVPAALVVGGVLGVLACERALADRRVPGQGRGGEAAGGERR